MIDHKPGQKLALWSKDSRIFPEDAEEPVAVPGRIQRLLLSVDYEDFADDIVVEDQFIELDKLGDPVR